MVWGHVAKYQEPVMQNMKYGLGQGAADAILSKALCSAAFKALPLGSKYRSAAIRAVLK